MDKNKMHIIEALEFVDKYTKDDVVGPCYALAHAIAYTPSMWNHTKDEVPGVVFCRFNKYTILIQDFTHNTEFLLRQDEDFVTGEPKYFLSGIDFNAYAEAEGEDYINAIASIAEYACS